MRWFKYTLSGVIEGRTVIETPGSIKPKQTTRLGIEGYIRNGAKVGSIEGA